MVLLTGSHVCDLSLSLSHSSDCDACCSVPIGTTTFPNQLPEALLSANVGALGVLLGEPFCRRYRLGNSMVHTQNIGRFVGARFSGVVRTMYGWHDGDRAGCWCLCFLVDTWRHAR